MTMNGEVLLGPERRRRFTDEEKLRILEETTRPGMSVSLVARRHQIHASVLFRWRARFLDKPQAAEPVLLPVQVASEPTPPPSPARPVRPGRRGGIIEIELGSGQRLRVGHDVDADALRRVLGVLEGR